MTISEMNEAIIKNCSLYENCFGCPVEELNPKYCGWSYHKKTIEFPEEVERIYNALVEQGYLPTKESKITESEVTSLENSRSQSKTFATDYINKLCEENLRCDDCPVYKIDKSFCKRFPTETETFELYDKVIMSEVDEKAMAIVIDDNVESCEIDHPHYYNQGNIECIDAMLSAFDKETVIAFCKLNAFKYIWRNEAKHENSIDDLNKCLWYIRKSVELMEDNND